MQPRPFNTIEKGQEVMAKLRIKYPEFANLDELIESYAPDMSGDQLSDYICRLSFNLVRINDVAAEFISKSNESYTYRKFEQLWQFNELIKKLTVKERENIALDNSYHVYEAELLNKYIADVVKARIDSVNKLISSIQTRLKFMRAEQINSNNQ